MFAHLGFLDGFPHKSVHLLFTALALMRQRSLMNRQRSDVRYTLKSSCESSNVFCSVDFDFHRCHNQLFVMLRNENCTL